MLQCLVKLLIAMIDFSTKKYDRDTDDSDGYYASNFSDINNTET